MRYKWFGAAMIIAGCTFFGISMAGGHKRKERQLGQLIHTLQFMEQELQYRLTPLPELCRQAGQQTGREIRTLFLSLSQELDRQTAPDVLSCMTAALEETKTLPEFLRPLLLRLGQTLGRFDLSGQLEGLKSVKSDCEETLRQLEQGRENRLRSYQTLAICAGIALVVLLV